MTRTTSSTSVPRTTHCRVRASTSRAYAAGRGPPSRSLGGMGDPAADETPLNVEPVDVDGVRAVAVGIVVWAVALVVLALIGKRGEVLWVCAAGVGLGLLGMPYVLRRRAAYRRETSRDR